MRKGRGGGRRGGLFLLCIVNRVFFWDFERGFRRDLFGFFFIFVGKLEVFCGF